jgi:hypothetical protein
MMTITKNDIHRPAIRNSNNISLLIQWINDEIVFCQNGGFDN